MPSRRRFLAGSLVLVAGGAGCLEAVARDDTGPTAAGESSTPRTETTGSKTSESATPTSDTDGAETTGTESDGAGTSGGASAGAETLLTVSGGDEEVDLLTYDHVDTVEEVREARSGDHYVVVVDLTDEGSESFSTGLEASGALDDPSAYELRLYLDGEVIFTARLGSDLAAAIEDGSWQGDDFVILTESRADATDLATALEDD